MGATEHEVSTVQREHDRLVAELLHACSVLSYYNAAEGDEYYKERDARIRQQQIVEAIKQECRDAGIDPLMHTRGKNYLL